MESIDDLETLLRSMDPFLAGGEYVFASLAGSDKDSIVRRTDPICTFREDEGLTVILRKEAADEAGVKYSATFRRITLRVHSSLESVGLTATVSSVLAERGISANVVAAFHHDHIFVPTADAERALEALRGIQD